MVETPKRFSTVGLLAIEDGKAPERVWVTRVGKVFTPQGEEYDITSKQLDELVANFATAKSRVDKPIPIDVSHSMGRGNLTLDDQQAVGWITDLEREGDSLWASVEWLAKAAGKVAEGAFRFTSPSIWFDWTDVNSGEQVGAYLDSLAITNRPVQDGVPMMADRAAIDALKEDGIEVTVHEPSKNPAALAVALSTEDSMNTTTIHLADGLSFDVPEDQAEKYIAAMASLKTAGDDKPDDTAALKADNDALRKELEETQAKVPAPDEVALSRDQFEKFELAQKQAAEATKKLANLEADVIRKRWVDEGRLTHKEGETKLYIDWSREGDAGRERFEAARQPKAAWDPSKPKGYSGTEGPEPEKTPHEQLLEFARVIEKDEGVSFMQAAILAEKRHPELARIDSLGRKIPHETGRNAA